MVKTRLLSLALLSLLVATAGYGRKIAAVGALCPDGARRQVDADEKKDVCVTTTTPSCLDGAALEVDRDAQGDSCVAGGKATKPTCGQGLKLSVRAGEDACEQRVRPECPHGFRLKVLPAEDKCVP